MLKFCHCWNIAIVRSYAAGAATVGKAFHSPFSDIFSSIQYYYNNDYWVRAEDNWLIKFSVWIFFYIMRSVHNTWPDYNAM